MDPTLIFGSCHLASRIPVGIEGHRTAIGTTHRSMCIYIYAYTCQNTGVYIYIDIHIYICMYAIVHY